ncbi:hypothetical protein PLESTB_000153300 [Pleodorina starrii]|uniref:Uncharacterized protein n=1 Tax=Pleodorina starrii TaxID=330485 RepID=A0A9W6BC51_9CHLO|nr:hypothetical protein PLESTB_000153300 [Pleodorina starrii]
MTRRGNPTCKYKKILFAWFCRQAREQWRVLWALPRARFRIRATGVARQLYKRRQQGCRAPPFLRYQIPLTAGLADQPHEPPPAVLSRCEIACRRTRCAASLCDKTTPRPGTHPQCRLASRPKARPPTKHRSTVPRPTERCHTPKKLRNARAAPSPHGPFPPPNGRNTRVPWPPHLRCAKFEYTSGRFATNHERIRCWIRNSNGMGDSPLLYSSQSGRIACVKGRELYDSW